MTTGRHAAPARLPGRRTRFRAVAAAALLLAVGVVAVVCVLTVDALGTGGRTIGSLVALWALVVGATGVRHGLRTGPTA